MSFFCSVLKPFKSSFASKVTSMSYLGFFPEVFNDDLDGRGVSCFALTMSMLYYNV